MRPHHGLAALTLALSSACDPAAVRAADEVAALHAPYAYVVAEDGLVPLGPLSAGHNALLLPLATRSERVPRPRLGPEGLEVVLVAGRGPLAVARLEARAVEHATDERLFTTADGPRLFGPPTLPTRTTPPRALAALARQDGVLAASPVLELEAAPEPGAMLVLGHGEWAATAAVQVIVDGAAHTLALGPHAVVAVPARARHTLDTGAVQLDHAAFRSPRALDLAAAPLSALRGGRVDSVRDVTLARFCGMGAYHPVPAFAEGATAPVPLDSRAEVRIARGDALRVALTPPAVAAGRSATVVLTLDVTLRDEPEATPERLALPDDGWLRDAGARAVAGPEPALLTHFEGPDEQLDIRPTMGPGAAWGDVDGDGWMDLYLVQGSGRDGSQPNPNRLLRNLGSAAGPGGPWFEDITARAGVGDTGAGMGALFLDLEGDGDQDLYVANYGRDVLYLNRGDGTFDDGSASLPGYDLWSAGVAAADPDGDGDLDLYVTSYLDYDPAKTPPVEELGRYQREDPLEMLPFAFPGQRNVFLRNDGVGEDGRPRLTDTTEELGLLDVPGRGMQPLFWDFDRDGDQDLYVANDVSYNVLFRNEGDGTFKDVSFATGLDDPRGGMGLAAADADGDGDEDVFLTNWQLDANALYVNSLAAPFETRTRRASFHDASVRAGLAQPSVGVTSWGVVFFDLELDGDLDAFVANGYTSPDYVGTGICVGQPNHLYVNDGAGRFAESSALAPAAMHVRLASRGAAGCDFDRDGDIDLVVTANNGPVQLLVNEAPRRGAWLGLALRQAGANPCAIGAEVTVRVTTPSGVKEHRRALRAGEGYLTGNPAELHFGLGEATAVTAVEVRWPDGSSSDLGALALGRWHTHTRR